MAAIPQYLVPKVGDGLTLVTAFRPKYFDGLIYSARDYQPGAGSAMLVESETTAEQHAALLAQSDVIAVPPDPATELGADLAAVQAWLQTAEIPGAWLTAATPWGALLTFLPRLFTLARRIHGRSAARLVPTGATLDQLFADLPLGYRLALADAALSLGLDPLSLPDGLSLGGTLRWITDQIGAAAPPVVTPFALPVFDEFLDAIGTLGASWTVELGDINCTGVGQVALNAGGNHITRWTADTFPDTQYAEAYNGSGDYYGPATRLNADTDGYAIYGHRTGAGQTLYRLDNDVLTSLQTLPTVASGAHTLRLESSGSTHTAFFDTVAWGSPQTDATYTSGSAGFVIYDITTIDSWGAGTLAAPPPSPYDAATDGGNNIGASSTTHSFTHTCSGVNRVLFVGIKASVLATGDVVTGVTYSGVAMTLLAKRAPGTTDGFEGNRWIYLYGLLAPATGANSVVVTSSVAGDGVLAGAVSYKTVQQSGLPDAVVTGSVHGATATPDELTLTLTTVTNNCWTMAVMGGYNAGAQLGISAGTTRRTSDATYGTWIMVDSNVAITPAGLASLAASYTSGNNGVNGVMVAFVLAPTDGPLTNLRRGRAPITQAVNRAATY